MAFWAASPGSLAGAPKESRWLGCVAGGCHACLDGDGFAPGLSSATQSVEDDYLVDVYGMYFNWLAIKDGRALTSFA